jgi:hypothetical protein
VTQFSKDPSASLDYVNDWTSWLATGETISTSTWTVPTGITKDSDSKTSTTTTIWLSGGTAGTVYTVANLIVTSASRTDERSFRILCEDR